jgi:triosephosphate isomerase (TIM)
MLIAGNWKMHTSRAEAVALAEAAASVAADLPAIEVAIMPPFPWLEAVYERIAGSAVQLGAQNLHEADRGAHTGEVAGEMLREVGCRYVIVGHSERRHLMGETDDQVGAKVAQAQRCGLRPILCVGETLDQRDAGREAEVVARQLGAALAGADLTAGLVIAYEPVWAIGTGRTATPEQAQAMHALIRESIGSRPGGAGLRILYGGSVKPDNAAELFARPDVDGGLIGGASLDADAFAAIARAAAGLAA